MSPTRQPSKLTKTDKWLLLVAAVIFLIIVIGIIYNHRGVIQAELEGGATTYSEDLVTFIIGKEGFEPDTYADSGGVLTIGYGHTGSDVTEGMTITQDQALTLLRADLNTAKNNVLNLVNVPLTTGQLNALTDFEFNTGALADGEDLLTFVNNKDFIGAANWLPNHYITSGGVQLPGLVTRRQWDAQQILS